ncbi:type I restriction endonuclease subunit S [Vibrio cholerae]|nr:type I restriction endonuclease subunit S [Vibrio cholerae]
MSQLPKGWVCTSISQCFELKNGYAFKSSDYTEDGDFVIRIGNVQDGHIILSNPAYVAAEKLGADSFKLNEGDILISLTGNVGRIGMVSKEHLPAVLNQRVAKICVVNSVEIRWLFYLLRTRLFQQHVLSLAKGAAQLNISTKDIQSFDFALPPLAEQTRIVEKLDEVLVQVDTIKARLDGIPAILKRFRQSVLAAAVSGKLTEEWRQLNPNQPSHPKVGKVKYKTDLFDSASKSLPELPPEWLVIPAAHLLEYVTSGSRGWANYYASSGALFLRMSNVRYDTTKLDLSDLQYVNLPENVEGKRSLVKENDLVISITADVGRVARVDSEIEEAYVNQHLALARPASHIDAEFLAKCIASVNIGIKQVQALKRGATKAGLGLDDIRSMAIPFPHLAEQKEIVRLVDQYFAFADTIEALVKKAQARVDKLTQSILAKAFRGELVPQDPNDEPADKLLERIATARKEAEALAKAAKKAGRKKVTA